MRRRDPEDSAEDSGEAGAHYRVAEDSGEAGIYRTLEDPGISRTPEDPAQESAPPRRASGQATRRSTRPWWNGTSGERRRAFRSRCYDYPTAAKVLDALESGYSRGLRAMAGE